MACVYPPLSVSHPPLILRLMGYRGKVAEQNEARRLRAKGLTMNEIAERVGVSKGSVSLWTRDVPFQPSLIRPRARRRGPNSLQQNTSRDHGARPRAGSVGETSGVAQSAERRTVNPQVASSSLAPGATVENLR